MKMVFKRYWLVVCIFLALLSLCVQYFRLSGRYGKPLPVLDTRPNNCYDKTLRVLARPYYNPYTFYDADGNPTGHDVELINIIANELEMNLDLRLTDWNSAIEAVKSGDADLLMACEFFNMHSPEAELAKTVYTVYDEFAVFGKKPLEKPIQLIGKRIGILKNGNVSSDLHSMGLAGKCTGYDSYFAAFKALMNGECEYVIGRTAVGIAILDNLGAKDIKPFMSIGSSSMCFGLSPENKELIAKIDDIIMKLKADGTLERLHHKWLTTFVQPYTFQDVMRNNPWLPMTTLALFALLAYVYAKWRWEKSSAEQQHQLELQEQNRKLEAARDMAQAANNAKTAFLFNMSHDIRTPMGAILGFTELAIKDIDDRKKTLDCLNKSKTSGEYLLSLINDILEMSRIESGKVTLEEHNNDIIDICESAISMLGILAEKKDISFDFKETGITDRYVNADSLRLKQIIINVLSNAMKYTESGGTVSFSVSQLPSDSSDKALFCFVVEDTGIGMSKEFQSHIFETFSRENTSTLSGRQGTGLGMAITKNLVELMGGTIEVESEQGKGSRFTIKVPLRTVNSNASAPKGSSIDTTCQPSLEGKKVLLVDDNELNREIASELLLSNGMEVEMAENGSIAVEILKGNGCQHYDFVLMDIQMPIMDGYEATKAIRALPDSDNLPIIALSANAFEEDRQKSLKAGMNAHIAKPIKVKELLETLRRFA